MSAKYNVKPLKTNAMKTLKMIIAVVLMTTLLNACQKEEVLPVMSSPDQGLKTTPAKQGDKAATATSTFKIQFEVVVHLSGEKPLCNAYMVELKDGNGRKIAENQDYIPGISNYRFFDNSAGYGVRIARLILNPNIDRIACPTELFTTPAILSDRFIPGGSYRLDLYPEDTPVKRSE